MKARCVNMGFYLNSTSAFSLYKSEIKKPYFVDKTMLLKELFPMVAAGNSHICITRPRRFGKTMAANMIGAFFGKGNEAGNIFDSLNISEVSGYAENLNHYNMIYIDFSKNNEDSDSYQEYIDTIKELLREDLHQAYSQIVFREKGSVTEDFTRIFNQTGDRFIFVLDEWDCIFHKKYITDTDKHRYISFLNTLLKDQPYVQFTYMTGILPIAKYSSGSELNMFAEFTMVNQSMFSQYFGFTDEEVDRLFDKYLENCKQQKLLPCVTRDGLRQWYNGYQTKSGVRVYNPRSVVFALQFNNLGNYWTSAGPYDEIFYYIEHNVADVRDDLALMAAGEAVPAKVQEYASTSMNLATKDEIFSAMVVYGFLSYGDGKVSIPNRELMEKFDEMLLKEPSLGYVYRLAKESDKMLAATLAGDTKTMEKILGYVHDTEVPILSYNHETELSAIVNLVYLSARDQYRIEREEKAGIGYVDFIFYPEDKKADCMILELKVDHTPEEAIQQIKEKRYALKFKGKIGDDDPYTGRILVVGIGYDKKKKNHQCKIEVL